MMRANPGMTWSDAYGRVMAEKHKKEAAADKANSFDSNAAYMAAKEKADAIYGAAGQQAIAIDIKGAPKANIESQEINAPNAITTTEIGTPSTISGPQADELRAFQLQSAQDAAAAPSAAESSMRGSLAAINRTQLGQAAAARGSNRLAARRDAMLATGELGMEAGQRTASLAATEEQAKRAALTSALSGVRAGDVSSAQTQAEIEKANAANWIAAQSTTEAQKLSASQANQQANLEAQKVDVANKQKAWEDTQAAKNAAYGTALQATGAETQAAGVASGLEAAKAEAKAKKESSLIGGAASIISSLSDEEAKENVTKLGGDSFSSEYNKEISSAFGLNQQDTKGQDFLDWQARDSSADTSSSSGGDLAFIGQLIGASDEQAKEAVDKIMLGNDESGRRTAMKLMYTAESPSARRKKADEAYSASGSRVDKILKDQANYDENAFMLRNANFTDLKTSDEAAKEAVSRMSTDDIVDWADDVPLAAFKYKKGVEGTDEGAAFHIGTLARELESTGPMGKMMVSERPDGFKQVDYGPLALSVAKAALAEAKEAKRLVGGR